MSLVTRDIASETLLSIGGLPRIGPCFISGTCENANMVLTDVWSACGIQPIKTYLAAAETLDVSSDSADDTFTGVGARQLILIGLDDNFDAIQEIINLDGVSTVTTTNSFLRLNTCRVIAAGTYGGTGTGSNVGAITIESSSTNNLEAVIGEYVSASVPHGQMLNSHFCTPRRTRSVIRNSVVIHTKAAQPVDIFLMSRVNDLDLSGAPFGSTRIVAVFPEVVGTSLIDVNTPPHVREKADVWFAAMPKVSNTPISVQYSIIINKDIGAVI